MFNSAKYCPARIARSLNGSFLGNALIQVLLNKNIKLISCKEGIIDFNNFNHQFLFNVEGSINSNQFFIQRKKAKDSFKRLKDSGDANSTEWVQFI